jgi:hypothetical protein
MNEIGVTPWLPALSAATQRQAFEPAHAPPPIHREKVQFSDNWGTLGALTGDGFMMTHFGASCTNRLHSTQIAQYAPPEGSAGGALLVRQDVIVY